MLQCNACDINIGGRNIEKRAYRIPDSDIILCHWCYGYLQKDGRREIGSSRKGTLALPELQKGYYIHSDGSKSWESVIKEVKDGNRSNPVPRQV
jgi:hypothetical protein